MSATTASSHANEPSFRRRWLGLVALCAAFFMVILDVAIVNVALPTIQVDLDFSAKNLQWVVSAYALTFGGLLLLGGRIADLVGRRRVFMLGVGLFALASLIAGLASAEETLITARALQGIGAALMTPAALSILMTTFAEGRERNMALGVWGAVGASGGTVGVLLGGVFADTIGWEWIFLLNVPVGIAVIASAPFLLDESRADAGHRRFDLAGGLSITASLALLVYALVEASSEGWGSATTIGRLAGSAALMALFIVIELRSRAPIMPFSIFRIRAVTGSNVAGFALGGAMFGMFFILTLYMQQVVQYSPLETGLAYLSTSLAAFIASVGGARLVTRIGPRAPMVAGLLLFALGVLLLAQIPADGEYVSDLLPGMLVSGLGLGLAFVSFSIGALEGVADRDAGLASGLSNTTQQIGGALGVAIMFDPGDHPLGEPRRRRHRSGRGSDGGLPAGPLLRGRSRGAGRHRGALPGSLAAPGRGAGRSRRDRGGVGRLIPSWDDVHGCAPPMRGGPRGRGQHARHRLRRRTDHEQLVVTGITDLIGLENAGRKSGLNRSLRNELRSLSPVDLASSDDVNTVTSITGRGWRHRAAGWPPRGPLPPPGSRRDLRPGHWSGRTRADREAPHRRVRTSRRGACGV